MEAIATIGGQGHRYLGGDRYQMETIRWRPSLLGGSHRYWVEAIAIWWTPLLLGGGHRYYVEAIAITLEAIAIRWRPSLLRGGRRYYIGGHCY